MQKIYTCPAVPGEGKAPPVACNFVETLMPLETHAEWRQQVPLVCRREFHNVDTMHTSQHDDFYALYIVQSGRGVHVINDRSFGMARGDVYLLLPGARHFYRDPKNLLVEAFYFQDALWEEKEREALRDLAGYHNLFVANTEKAEGSEDGFFAHLSVERYAELELATEQMRRDADAPEVALRLAARSRFFVLLTQLSVWRGNHAVLPHPPRALDLAEVLSFCESNFHRPLRVERLAALIGYSPTHFAKHFAREIGMPPAAYVRHLRLQRAQTLLRESLHPVADVARLVGFGDITQFGRIFKATFGQTPIEYRRAHKRSRKPT